MNHHHLNIGAGPLPLHQQHVDVMQSYAPLADWTLVDSQARSPQHQSWDAGAIPLEPGSVRTIYSSHMLEHLTRRALVPVLRHWRRLLYPSGVLHLNVPDLEWAARRLLALLAHERGGPPPGPPDYFNRSIAYDDQHERSMLAVIYGAQDHPGDFHQTGFTEESLARLLRDVGFKLRDSQRIVEAHDVGCIIAVAVAS